MSHGRIPSGAKVPLEAFIISAIGEPLAGKADIKLRCRRSSDDKLLDWADQTFKTAGTCTQPLEVLEEVDAANDPGYYRLNTAEHVRGFDTSALVNPAVEDHYSFTIVQTPGNDASNVPQYVQLDVGGWIDYLDASIAARATPAQVYTQSGAALSAVGLDHLVATTPGGAPAADGTYMKQMIDKLDSLLIGGRVYRIKQNWVYNPATDTITGQVWCESDNQVVAVPLGLSVAWCNAVGTVMFNLTDDAPDAHGIFNVNKVAPGLVKNTSYYSLATVTTTEVGDITASFGIIMVG
jgi:hypothetical protein